jgi:hypothetical protein
MNALPVRLAAGLALIALCALAQESPNAKMAELQANPAMAKKTPPPEYGLNGKPMILPPQIVDVDGLRRHMYLVNQELQEAFQRQQKTAQHALYQKALTNNTVFEAFVDWDENGHRPVALPVLRSSW